MSYKYHLRFNKELLSLDLGFGTDSKGHQAGYASKKVAKAAGIIADYYKV